MFWKLFKFELNGAYRSFSLFYAILLVSAAFIGFGSLLPQSNLSLFAHFFLGISAFLYSSMLFAVNILTVVFVVRGFHQSMYKRNAYLTHTLPVSMRQLMLVKILSAVFWIFITLLVEILSAGITIVAAGHLEAILEFFQHFGRFWAEIHNKGELFSIMLEGLMLLMEAITILYFVVNFVHSIFVQRGRIAIAIILIIVIETLESLFLNWFSGHVMISMLNLSDVSMNLVLTLIYLLLVLVWFYGSVYLLEHKMEVE